MHFTDRMGIAHLWVDSLCIVQDDEISKRAQISNMGNVFSGALFTIVAAYGNNCHAGLPGSRSRSRQIWDGRVTLRGSTMACELPGYTRAVEGSTWNSRAWTYQEAELSRRHVIFTEHQVFYRCARCICHEQTGSIIQKSSGRYIYNIKLAYQPNVLSYSDAVRNYTKRSLGRPDDILNGFQGLLDLLLPLFKGNFVYGLPETELDFALLWQPYSKTFRRRLHPRTGRPMFPSWSWAGWEGGCNYLHWTNHMLDDLSRVQWQDAVTGSPFSSDEIRAPKNGPSFRSNDHGDRKDGWKPRRTSQRFGYDILAWIEDKAPALWCLHPIAEPSERAPRTLVLSGFREIRFRALTAYFTLVEGVARGKPGPITPLLIHDKDGFSAGVIHIHQGLLGDLPGFRSVPESRPSDSTTVDVDSARTKPKTPHRQKTHELVCLSRRRGSDWSSYKSQVYENTIYKSPQPSDDFASCPAQHTLYPGQSTDMDNDDYIDAWRYNVHMQFPLYNIMLIKRLGGEDGVAERIAIGTIHVTAFL